MSTVVEITAQVTNDPNIKGFHTRFQMADAPEMGLRGDSSGLGAFGNLVLEIRGIVQIHVCPYVLLVTKAPLFSWDEVEPQVIGLLKQAVASQRQMHDAVENPTSSGDRV